jgi:RING finger protein 113A
MSGTEGDAEAGERKAAGAATEAVVEFRRPAGKASSRKRPRGVGVGGKEGEDGEEEVRLATMVDRAGAVRTGVGSSGVTVSTSDGDRPRGSHLVEHGVAEVGQRGKDQATKAVELEEAEGRAGGGGARAIGPLRGASNIRSTVTTDFKLDLCKDYYETGRCAFGDTCIYMHERNLGKLSYEMDRESEQQQKQREDELRRRLLGDIAKKPEDPAAADSAVAPPPAAKARRVNSSAIMPIFTPAALNIGTWETEEVEKPE